jgi:hypothetical protein
MRPNTPPRNMTHRIRIISAIISSLSLVKPSKQDLIGLDFYESLLKIAFSYQNLSTPQFRIMIDTTDFIHCK